MAAELLESLQKMIGFRNVAVRDCQKVDRAILQTIVRERLPDLERFGDAVRAHLARRGSRS